MYRLAPALLLAASAPANASGDKAAVERAIRAVLDAEQGKDFFSLQSSTWPDGHFAVRLAGQPRKSYERKRWADVVFGGIGVNYETRIVAMTIKLHGNHVDARVREHSRIYYSDEFSGRGDGNIDEVRLERRHGEWRVLDWERTVRQFGSDAAWHRRHP